MSGPFKRGDIAVWQNQVGEFAYLNGKEVQILGDLSNHFLRGAGLQQCYEIDLKNEIGRNMFALPHELRRRKPPTEFKGELRIAELIRETLDKAPQRQGEPA